MMERAEELRILTKPVVEWLRKNYDPYTTIIINDDFVKITRVEVGVPFNIE